LNRPPHCAILFVSKGAIALSIRKVSIRQIKAARALLGWSQEDAANFSGVSVPTIKRLEATDGPIGGRASTGERIKDAMEAAGIAFIDENGGGPGVRLRRPRHSGYGIE
jgi:DNA-binding XRE family transcriptional regulator